MTAELCCTRTDLKKENVLGDWPEMCIFALLRLIQVQRVSCLRSGINILDVQSGYKLLRTFHDQINK